ncbi:MAG: DNA topoisomerase IB [Caulobacteraceae bacterium]
MAHDTPPDVAASGAVSHGLVYVHDHDPGITRVGGPAGVRYLDPAGKTVRDREILDRIGHLAIPPAWSGVWICPDPAGHIQAVGRDARGRKQYLYHSGWRSFRDEAKYDKLRAFGRALPRLRAQVEADLARRGLPREKVLAAVIRLLEITLIRVGNEEYARANKSFGLTTMLKKHVSLTDAGAVFEFRGKSGVAHRTAFHDRRLARVLHGCEGLRGQRLFQYVDDTGERHGIESADVNAYLHAAMGEAFSAKDFRTWAGALMAGRALALQPAPANAAEAKRAVVACVKAVAGVLGNTPAVCRACYIHPKVFEAFDAGALSPRLAGEAAAAERALLRLLGVG